MAIEILLEKIAAQTPISMLERYERIPATVINALALGRIAIDERPMIHRMAQAPHFMLQSKLLASIFRVDDVFEAKLMIAHVFGNQAAALQETIRIGKVGH